MHENTKKFWAEAAHNWNCQNKKEEKEDLEEGIHPNNSNNWTEEYISIVAEIMIRNGFEYTYYSDDEWYITMKYVPIPDPVHGDCTYSEDEHYFEFGTFHGHNTIRWGIYDGCDAWAIDIPRNLSPDKCSPEWMAAVIMTEEAKDRITNNRTKLIKKEK